MLPQPTPQWKTEYQIRAEATRARRRAAGLYPTKAQKDAFAKSMRRNGRESLTIEEMGLLATHPQLAPSQRAEYAEMAHSAVAAATHVDVLGDFMAHTSALLDAGLLAPLLSPCDADGDDECGIGEDESRHPFYY